MGLESSMNSELVIDLTVNRVAFCPKATMTCLRQNAQGLTVSHKPVHCRDHQGPN